ncbi:MAG TPA: hypothetical protein VH950_17845 [Gaiellaceae bacterium]|jgi:hypothetical protein
MAEVAPRERDDERSGEPPADLPDELAAALQRVNRIRVEHGADPLYELPQAQPASVPGSVCVLQEAFADLGVSTVDYYYLVGKGVRIEHGLSWFVRRFDAGAYPQLVAAPRAGA